MLLLDKKYWTYGSSIVLGKGLELGSYFLASYWLSKQQYGQFEYYRRIIELGAIIISFGSPVLLMTYTRNDQNKVNFYAISVVISCLLSILSFPFLKIFHLEIIVLPILFFSLFHHSGSISQSYLLVKKGSNTVAIYKMVYGFLLSLLTVLGLSIFSSGEKSLIYASSLLLILGFADLITELLNSTNKSYLKYFKNYFRHYIKLIWNSLSLILNSIVSIAFFTSAILIIKFLGKDQTSEDIANIGFVLTISDVLLLIPLTFSQVDIESMKLSSEGFEKVQSTNLKFTFFGTLLVGVLYLFLIFTFFKKFDNTYILFLVLLIGKCVQSISIPFGVYLTIKKRFLETYGSIYIHFF